MYHVRREENLRTSTSLKASASPMALQLCASERAWEHVSRIQETVIYEVLSAAERSTRHRPSRAARPSSITRYINWSAWLSEVLLGESAGISCTVVCSSREAPRKP